MKHSTLNPFGTSCPATPNCKNPPAPAWAGNIRSVSSDFKGDVPPFRVEESPIRDFKARPDVAKLPADERRYLGTALAQAYPGSAWDVVAVFGKPGKSLDAGGKLQSYTMAVTALGADAFHGVKPDDPEFKKAQLAIGQREALMKPSRNLAGPGR